MSKIGLTQYNSDLIQCQSTDSWTCPLIKCNWVNNLFHTINLGFEKSHVLFYSMLHLQSFTHRIAFNALLTKGYFFDGSLSMTLCLSNVISSTVACYPEPSMNISQATRVVQSFSGSFLMHLGPKDIFQCPCSIINHWQEDANTDICIPWAPLVINVD